MCWTAAGDIQSSPQSEAREGVSAEDMPFGEALKRFAETDPKLLADSRKQINALPRKMPDKLIGSKQASLNLSIEKDTEIGGIGMGVLSDGTPYLSQRGIAALRGGSGSSDRVIGGLSA